MDRSQLYVTAVVKEPTPGNRMPRTGEIERWMPCLEAEIREVRPRWVVLMGRVAWKAPRFQGIGYIKTYHPAAAMRFPEIRKKFVRDIKGLKHKMSRAAGHRIRR